MPSFLRMGTRLFPGSLPYHCPPGWLPASVRYAALPPISAHRHWKTLDKKVHIPDWVRRLLGRSASHRYYPLVVAAIAFVATATFSFSFVVVLIPAVLIAPRRWLSLGLLSGLTSGLGGGLLVAVFHFMGYELVLSHFPQFAASEKWQLAAEWLNHYGLAALALIAGSPMPQTPVVLVYSTLPEPSIWGAAIAIGIGKTVKYVLLAWLAQHFPAKFAKYYR